MYYRYHIKKGLALVAGLKIVRYQKFARSLNQTQKRKEKKRKDIKKEEDVEDELANQFKDTMNISTNVAALVTFNRYISLEFSL